MFKGDVKPGIGNTTGSFAWVTGVPQAFCKVRRIALQFMVE